MKYHLVIRKISLALLALLLFSCAHGQSRKDLEERKKKKLEEIAFTQKLIDQTSAAKKKNINYLYIIQRQIKNREELISTETRVLSLMNRNIERSSLFVQALEKDIESLKKEYIDMAYFAFKNRSSYDYLLYIFASKSLNEAWNRMRYIRYYSEIRSNQIELIKSTQRSLGRKISHLKEQISTKEALLLNLENEKVKLERNVSQKNEILKELKGKEEEYLVKLKNDKKIARELDLAIEEIIKEEIARATTLELSGLSSNQFATNRTKFIWPTNGIISQKFGRQEHPTISGVYITNNGINIRTDKEAVVRSVFPGNVVHVVFIPGANNAIIIRHGDYYTVYKNIVEVAVKPGDEVIEGQELGKVSYDPDKEISELHFEVRHKTEKLDPSLWLRTP